MPDIYYSKRSGAETDRILDKANGIKINDAQSSNILLNTIKIGDNIFKPNIPQKKYVYIHVVEIYFEHVDLYEGKLRTLITIDDRATPYVKGTEYLFFKSFGGGVFLSDMQLSQDFTTGCSFFCCVNDNEYVNGMMATYEQSDYYNYPFTWITGKARINEDIIYRLEVNEI